MKTRRERRFAEDLIACCGDRFVSTGVAHGSRMLALLGIFIGMALYFVGPGAYFGDAPLGIGVIVAVAQLGMYLMACSTDPGVLPRATAPTVQERLNQRPLPNQTILTGRGRVVVRHCDVCLTFRPERAEHCPTCDNCVLGFDHHCPWTGTCIGLRNHKYFYAFLVSTCCMEILVAAASAAQIADLQLHGPGATTGTGPVAMAGLIFAVLVSLTSFPLCFLHTYLIWAGTTTHDFMRGYARPPRSSSCCAGDRSCVPRWIRPGAPLSFVRSVRKAEKDQKNRIRRRSDWIEEATLADYPVPEQDDEEEQVKRDLEAATPVKRDPLVNPETYGHANGSPEDVLQRKETETQALATT